MKLEVKKWIFDILTSIDSIQEYTLTIESLEAYQNNKLVKRAVERELEIIGEAVKRIKVIDPEFPISNSKEIIGTRNWVIHAYDNVDDTIIWGIVTNYLDLLRSELSPYL
jgi:uncharacterized protein with HEPN domain